MYNFSTFETKVSMTKFNHFCSSQKCSYLLNYVSIICIYDPLKISYTYLTYILIQSNFFDNLYLCTDFFCIVKKVPGVVLRLAVILLHTDIYPCKYWGAHFEKAINLIFCNIKNAKFFLYWNIYVPHIMSLCTFLPYFWSFWLYSFQRWYWRVFLKLSLALWQ